ncbi:PhzF family phenazine biosynthesis protein [Pseudalkalibacillus caeni]|uniref:PhzF family phenazine biosynthesis protein n=1 Tax=Exobacillus caeni TaxID=2574798 RepID=A0A5R9EWA2_9BACL|nr:PhzF family phenazine biosynthesis protein [Pseudalkalibacillus caeni]TLS35081.1 PhzF family phenazine biosynthesis protein [Pseudalkalibacillus caeni]
METLEYSLLDVFTTTKFGGNQLAVFKSVSSLSNETMQKIARELNLSETTFVFEPDDSEAHRKVKIFTPQMELPMAGHPTVGTAYVLASEGLIKTEEGKNTVIFEENVGKITVDIFKENNRIVKVEMTQPVPEFGAVFDNEELAAELLSLSVDDLDNRYPIQTVSAGVPFIYIPVKNLEAMERIKFRLDIWQDHFSGNEDTKHIFVLCPEVMNEGSTVNSRMFAPAMGISEDPASGAATGPLGAYLVKYGIAGQDQDGEYKLRSEQGIQMGRPSFIDIKVKVEKEEVSEVKIGGSCVEIGEGKLYL